MAITTAVNKITKALCEPTFYKVIQGGQCFVAGTKVLMADGSYRPIEILKGGEKVLSRGADGGIIITEVRSSWYAGNTKPMITIIVGGEKIKATYDHKFYSAGEYKELYKIAWGKMAESQRVRLKLLCKQYGQNIDIDGAQQEEQSSDNETVLRLRLQERGNWIFENGDGQEKYQSPSGSCCNLDSKSKEQTLRESQEWEQDRQQSRESGVGHKLGEPIARLQDWPKQIEERRRCLPSEIDSQRRDGNKGGLGYRQGEAISERLCEEIQSVGIHDKRRAGEPFLEMATIDKVWVSQPEEVYSLEINHPSHNYFVSEQNINVSNSAGKTYAIMWLLESYCGSYPDSIVTVLGLTYDHLATGAIRDFKSIMKETGRWVDEWWNKTEKTYHFPNGSILEFKSVDRMTSRGPRRDVLFVNEANGITYEVFGQMANRTKDFVILDYNPSAKFWAHEELLEKQPDRTTFLVLTYKDNEAISNQERENIESHRPKAGEEPSNWWIVYGLGQIGSLEGNIYSGWEEVSAEEIKKNGKLVRYGLDFGFGHPTAMTGIYEFEDGSLGITEEIYEQGILSSHYPELLKSHNIDPSVLIVADAARPEIISDIKQAGWRIIPANKDSGSVMRGISRVQERQIKFAGKNLKKEYLGYAWRKQRSTGQTIYEPEKSEDDLMDSLRYAIDDLKMHRIQF